ncbi:A-kinase anchor protein 13 [Elysia marginata]|uniref:A-kinase anchor protein 13 n=1 Tax=Elysia marginata TaxID=1093978 RepID=A0AAV4GEK5_9GAST|nr:A-kinase anchor protein 13 [Elysia marginata]
MSDKPHVVENHKKIHKHAPLRDRRRRQFGRHSSSCPSLSATASFPVLSPVEEIDHHKSMHDLVEELGTSPQLSSSLPQEQTTTAPLAGETTEAARLRSENQPPQLDTQGDQAIRICVNGVTVDSSEDLASASGNSGQVPAQSDTDCSSPPHRKNARLRDGREEEDSVTRRGSWCPDRPSVRSGFPIDRRDQQTRVRMLAMSGKSLSLNSLDGGELSDEEDLNSPCEEVPPPGPLTTRPPPARPMHPNTGTVSCSSTLVRPHRAHHRASRTQSDAEIERDGGRTRSPIHSTGSNPGLDMGEDLSLSSHGARSLNDISSVTATSSKAEKAEGSHTGNSGTPSGPIHRAHHSYDEAEGAAGLVVPHTAMTKSLSTPSIPQATAADTAGPATGRREGKHAQFRRQKEIEEEEDDDRDKKSTEISWRDFLTEEQSPNDSDEKSSKGVRKEEKKRKPSVFSRFQSSYRTKKWLNVRTLVCDTTIHQWLNVRTLVCDTTIHLWLNVRTLVCDTTIHQWLNVRTLVCDTTMRQWLNARTLVCDTTIHQWLNVRTLVCDTTMRQWLNVRTLVCDTTVRQWLNVRTLVCDTTMRQWLNFTTLVCDTTMRQWRIFSTLVCDTNNVMRQWLNFRTFACTKTMRQ